MLLQKADTYRLLTIKAQNMMPWAEVVAAVATPVQAVQLKLKLKWNTTATWVKL